MRILLVTHETSRTGAPRVAIMMARGLAAEGNEVRVVARFPGPLLPEFRSVVPTSTELLHRVRRRMRSIRMLSSVAFALDTAVVMATVMRHRPDIVYVNSSAAAIYLRPARWLRRPVILHVHESAAIVQDFFDRARASGELAAVDMVACSPSVQDDLAMLTGHDLRDVPLIPSVPDDAMVLSQSAAEPDIEYRPDELIVGCCGAVEHRKGADLWEEIAERVNRAFPGRTVRFVWIGQDDVTCRPAAPTWAEFVGPRANPYPHMRRFDVFALPSRDDPFPLVVIEAMLLSKPVVAFDVGGIAQQLGDAGLLVPVGDVGTFADRIVQLLRDEHLRRSLGDRAYLRASRKFSTAAFMTELNNLIRDGRR